MKDILEFCEIARKRSIENEKSFEILYHSNLFGQTVSILRQELDTLVRVIFLLSKPIEQRRELVKQTLTNEKCRIGKTKITDKMMVDLSTKLNGWSEYVYKFGCAFIHLSNFHDYEKGNLFNNITVLERNNIINYLNSYHGFRKEVELNNQTIIPYLPKIFKKINGNLDLYIKSLEDDEKEIY
jgi:hypothetical protein